MTDTSHELSVTRFIAAPSARVWQVMTERQEEWWCPKPWEAKFDFVERRAGGRNEMTFRGPDGEIEPQKGIYLAWEEGRRFVVTDAVTVDPVTGGMQPAGPFMLGTWEIAPEGEGTRYTATARHWTEETCKQHAEMGFVEGWSACADQLKALCEAS
jgi:uncharacterized protein YndB with AHSA1/START domain